MWKYHQSSYEINVKTNYHSNLNYSSNEICSSDVEQLIIIAIW